MAAVGRFMGRLVGLAVLVTAGLLSGTARAQLFEDVQARNAIIELRQSVNRLTTSINVGFFIFFIFPIYPCYWNCCR